MTTTQESALDPLTTEKLAALLGLKKQSLRKRFCQTGSYFGVVPTKLPNGRLLWPGDSIARLTGA
ncbi:DNA-binding protein [Paraburkholderia monticola]|uniref:DNA-binding protein n=1 Tax=Paraburkholderia monticola TaxID=1399968 RepID=A0A149Q1F9_9BURK|nr:hypothetical protein [Paraburkholderia monticola]KXU91083.1 DNA-binding protein [Paraburkholderia monticola]